MNERKDKLTVGEWMSSPVLTIDAEDSVRDAFCRMRTESVRHLIVINNDKEVVGIVTDRDLRRPDISNDAEGWNDYYRLDEDYIVEDIMTKDVHCVHTKDKLEKTMNFMIDKKIGGLPVLDKNNQLAGIITTYDLMKVLYVVLKNSRDIINVSNEK